LFLIFFPSREKKKFNFYSEFCQGREKKGSTVLLNVPKEAINVTILFWILPKKRK